MTWPGSPPRGPAPVRWLPGGAAFAVVVVLTVVAVAVGSKAVRVGALVGAPSAALLATAACVVLAHRRPDTRAVAIGLVWSAPVCTVVAAVALLRS